MTIGVVGIGNLVLESGALLLDVELAYEISGPADAPVILACHALTGNHLTVGSSALPGWWAGLVGPQCPLDTNRYRVITFNVIGGCNGSTGPLHINPETGKPYRADFPSITIRDIVHAEKKGLENLGISRVFAVIGGSLGGMQVLEWGLLYPDDMELLIPLAVTPELSDYGIAFNYIGIHAIEQDPHFRAGNYRSATDVKGFETARIAGMVSYRSQELFSQRFNREERSDGIYEVESYMKHMGRKITGRFDPNSYLTLLRAMNSHDIGKGRGGFRGAVKGYKAKVAAIGFTYDLIYPSERIREFTHSVPNGNFHLVHTKFGHDGFLTEYSKWGFIIQANLEANACKPLKLHY
ncbi:homoserine O-acetyltransferase [Chungangia koreensis]|uniref:Homoserine O-acetyltransferase n=1 Tax=Chungangia koreensis TaxID=752657 RepID=A0ABV8X6S7_9LACT